jgi:hypothetical protein
MSIDNPLEFVTTADMIAEIKRRHPSGALIVTVTDLDAKRESYLAQWSGGPVIVMGLAEYARLRALREIDDPPGSASGTADRNGGDA